MPTEGYVFHIYGDVRYATHAAASLATLRRHDLARPVALFCTDAQRDALRAHGLDRAFDRIEHLPEAHRSITGFKHHLDRFKPYARSLFVDVDMIWCKDPDPLWRTLSAYPFTATGWEKADPAFGGPKGAAVVWDVLRDRRRKTMRAFGLTHFPRVQGGMLFGQDDATTREVCATARRFLDRRAETHFRSRLDEGRAEESCEWSLACAMSRLQLPVLEWHQGHASPQLDYIGGMVQHDEDYQSVLVRYYSDPFVYSLRGVQNEKTRDRLIRLVSSLPGRGDFMDVTPFVLHFGWKWQKAPWEAFAARTWQRLTRGDLALPAVHA